MKRAMMLQRSAVLIIAIVFTSALNGTVADGGERSTGGINAQENEGDASSENRENPVMKAMKMIDEMMKKVHEDSVKEKQMFQKYEYWCGRQSRETKEKIANAKAQIESLSAKIMARDSEITKLKHTIEFLSGDSSFDDAQKEKLLDKRNREKGQYEDLLTEIENGLKVTRMAIEKVSKAIVQAGGQVSLLQKGGKLRGPVLTKPTKGMKAFTNLMEELANAELLATMSRTGKPESLLQTDKAETEMHRAAEARRQAEKTAHATSEAEIPLAVHQANLKMLKDIQSKSTESAARAKMRERKNQEAYDDALAEIENKHATKQRDLRQAKRDLVTAKADRAEAADLLASFKEDLKKYEEYLKTVESECLNKAAAFQEQQKARVKEKAAIQEAKKALKSVTDTKANKNLYLVQEDSGFDSDSASGGESRSESGPDSDSKTSAGGITVQSEGVMTLAGEPIISFLQLSSEQEGQNLEVKDALRAFERAQERREIAIPRATMGGYFLQLSGVSSSQSAQTLLLVQRKLQNLASKISSPQLAQLAKRIQAIHTNGAGSGADPIAKVRKMLYKMVDDLMEKNQALIDKTGYCEQQTKHTLVQLKICKNDLKDKLAEEKFKTAEVATLEQDVMDLEEEIAMSLKSDKASKALREVEHKNNVQAFEDLENGIKGVGNAIEILRDYYNMQNRQTVKMRKDVGADMKIMAAGGHPGFSKAPVGSHASKQVVTLLEDIAQQFEIQLDELKTDDRRAQEDYTAMMRKSFILRVQKENDKKHKESDLKRYERDLRDLKWDLQKAKDKLQTVVDYKKRLDDECTIKGEARKARIARREAEMAGLKSALAILEGIKTKD